MPARKNGTNPRRNSVNGTSNKPVTGSRTFGSYKKKKSNYYDKILPNNFIKSRKDPKKTKKIMQKILIRNAREMDSMFVRTDLRVERWADVKKGLKSVLNWKLSSRPTIAQKLKSKKEIREHLIAAQKMFEFYKMVVDDVRRKGLTFRAAEEHYGVAASVINTWVNGSAMPSFVSNRAMMKGRMNTSFKEAVIKNRQAMAYLVGASISGKLSKPSTKRKSGSSLGLQNHVYSKGVRDTLAGNIEQATGVKPTVNEVPGKNGEKTFAVYFPRTRFMQGLNRETAYGTKVPQSVVRTKADVKTLLEGAFDQSATWSDKKKTIVINGPRRRTLAFDTLAESLNRFNIKTKITGKEGDKSFWKIEIDPNSIKKFNNTFQLHRGRFNKEIRTHLAKMK